MGKQSNFSQSWGRDRSSENRRDPAFVSFPFALWDSAKMSARFLQRWYMERLHPSAGSPCPSMKANLPFNTACLA
ncbi:hypothetical protein CgunFtcFv8_004184 [Champsocephalus gunnari]|uniref:Uncharacterized protein n=1 Tax=Champsocephalus gunnari TaxID=52237 RepID=A0AAN8HYH1_CHAGU|nr:hypothetical protein CgunFtcFv8_004184 [Champsocephalus gunnari]